MTQFLALQLFQLSVLYFEGEKEVCFRLTNYTSKLSVVLTCTDLLDQFQELETHQLRQLHSSALKLSAAELPNAKNAAIRKSD